MGICGIKATKVQVADANEELIIRKKVPKLFSVEKNRLVKKRKKQLFASVPVSCELDQTPTVRKIRAMTD